MGEECVHLNPLYRQFLEQLGTANEHERTIIVRQISGNADATGSRPA